MRILLIACSYPPDPFVGSFRAAKVAHAMRSAGHDVEVITSRLSGEKDPLRVDEPGLRVHTVRDVRGPRTVYRALVRRVRGNDGTLLTGAKSTGADGASGSKTGTGAVPRWKRYLLSMIWVPDDRQGFIPPALREARRFIRDGVDLVYTTAPPFSDHLVGLVLKRLGGVRWVAEFRDPWIENANRHAYLRSAAMDAVNRSLERLCIRYADHLVAVSEGTAALLRAKLPATARERVLLALNGIDNLAPASSPAPDPRPIRFMHTGNCYGGRDPRLFLRALAAVAGRRGLGSEDVRAEFIGHCRSYCGESLEVLAKSLGISELVSFTDWIPQEEARRRAGTAHVFVLPLPEKKGVIPNKLFDYLGMRRPILAFVNPDSEVARMLGELGNHILVTSQCQEEAEAGIERALTAAHSWNAGAGDHALLSEWTTEVQMRRLLSGLGLGLA
jgi:glycosyltransferase involved in cell wall biosynthesis